MNKTAMDVIELVSCAVNGRVPEKARVEAMDPEAVFAFAAKHMLTAAVAFAMESAGYRTRNSSQAIAAAVRKTAMFDQTWASIRSELEHAGIWYMPLKGAVLKEMYPKFGMREFADFDILIDPSRSDDVKMIMEKLEFKTEHFGLGAHDCYEKLPCLNFEMHHDLFVESDSQQLSAYYQDVERRLNGEGYEKHFSPEDLYLYLLAHEYKHFSHRGTGLRSLVDSYVFLKAEKLDMDYVAAEADKLGIRDFEKQNRELSLHLFGGGKLTETDQRMLNYYLSSGTYGTYGHNLSNMLNEKQLSRLQYMKNRFCVPLSKKNPDYAGFAEKYPVFYRYKILLPTLPFYRIFLAMKAGRFQNEAKAIWHAADNGVPK